MAGFLDGPVHAITGEVQILSTTRLFIKDFNFDGQSPGSLYLVESSHMSVHGIFILCHLLLLHLSYTLPLSLLLHISSSLPFLSHISLLASTPSLPSSHSSHSLFLLLPLPPFTPLLPLLSSHPLTSIFFDNYG